MNEYHFVFLKKYDFFSHYELYILQIQQLPRMCVSCLLLLSLTLLIENEIITKVKCPPEINKVSIDNHLSKLSKFHINYKNAVSFEQELGLKIQQIIPWMTKKVLIYNHIK